MSELGYKIGHCAGGWAWWIPNGDIMAFGCGYISEKECRADAVKAVKAAQS